MATLVPSRSSRKEEPTGGSGNQDRGPDEPGYGGDGSSENALPDRRYYTGMLVGLAGIVMLFTGFSSAYVVRQGLSGDWVPLHLPSVLWLNTLILLASSFTLEQAKRKFSSVIQLRRWFTVSGVLGLVFLIGQWVAWRQLVAQGVYINTNPSSSFFYVLTVTHALHVLGGVLAFAYLTFRLWTGRLTPVATGVLAIYWHFLDGLWIYLLLLLVFW